jgi:drug/metabolite transporter (DMT)-like permease
LGYRRRMLPSGALLASCAMVVAGVAILANINWTELHPGRGEMETIASSLFFTGQILWLQRGEFLANRMMPVTFVMFSIVTLLLMPMALLSGGGAGHCLAAFESIPAVGMIGFLAIGCTVIAYGLMNRWQPHIPATEAALVYCCEPVFASIFALFAPAWLSVWAGNIDYANEKLGWRLLVGGGLISAANLVILLRAQKP